MKLCIVAAVSCLLAAAVGAQTMDQASVDMTEFPGVVRFGADATFTCVLSGYHTQQETIVNFHKAVVGENFIGHPVTEQISQSTQLSGLYRRLPRFSIERNTAANKIEVKLHIKGVQHEDSGWYACSARHDQYGDKYAVKQLEVYRLPHARLSLNETTTGHPERRLEWNNETLVFTEGDIIPIHCIAEGVLPIPSLELWVTDSDKETINPHSVGPQPISEFVDRWRQDSTQQWRLLNDKYLVATERNVYCDSLAGPGVCGVDQAKGDCPLSFDFNLTATPRDLTADWRYDEKKLTCLVTMRDLERDSAQASVTLSVLYKPKLTCNSVTTGQLRTLVCRVTANPKVTGDGGRAWSEGPCSQEGTPIDENSLKYKLNELIGNPSFKNTTFVLQLNNATNVNQKFCLRVTNEMGVSAEELIYKDPPPPRGAASALTSSGALLAATTLLLLRRRA